MGEWKIQITGEVADELKSALDRASGAANQIKLLVAMLDGMKLEVFSNEHPPPHFRVYYQGKTNNFRIADCSPMHGDSLGRYYRVIREWHNKNKHELINAWNKRRPSNCPVGEYREKIDQHKFLAEPPY